MIINLTSSSHFVEVTDVAQYNYVALVKSNMDNSMYLLGDFVGKSYVGCVRIGLIGISGIDQNLYIPINIRRNVLGFQLVSKSLEKAKSINCEVVLHFKK